jgi:hypothetical protein
MGRPWTADEDAMLIANANRTASWDGWKRVLPGRSHNAIAMRRHNLGVAEPLTYEDWTHEQRSRLVSGLHALCEEVGHDPHQCIAELHRIAKRAKKKEARLRNEEV